MGSRGDSLREVMRFIERFTLTRAWTDLTDEELLWEPMPGSWGIHPVGETRSATPFLVGDWAADMDSDVALDPQAIEPLTSIGWLFWHCGSMPARTAELDVFGGDDSAEEGWTSPYLNLAGHPIFRTADEAVSSMRDGWRALRAALKSVTDEQLEQPRRFQGYGGPGPMGTGSQIVAGCLNEVSHHATQICTLRDLYALRGGAPIERLVD